MPSVLFTVCLHSNVYLLIYDLADPTWVHLVFMCLLVNAWVTYVCGPRCCGLYTCCPADRLRGGCTLTSSMLILGFMFLVYTIGVSGYTCVRSSCAESTIMVLLFYRCLGYTLPSVIVSLLGAGSCAGIHSLLVYRLVCLL